MSPWKVARNHLHTRDNDKSAGLMITASRNKLGSRVSRGTKLLSQIHQETF